jgi:hypothetical protein
MLKRPKVMAPTGLPTGMTALMGAFCKSTTVNNTYLCGKTLSYSPSTTWKIFREPLTGNWFGNDTNGLYYMMYFNRTSMLYLYDST